MGRCIKCGRQYCNCPTDGVCDNCASAVLQGQNGSTQIAGCSITVADLDEWKRRCECMLKTNAGVAIGIGHSQVNRIYAYVMSAWNYRSNPCMFSQYIPQIQQFIQILDINSLCNL